MDGSLPQLQAQKSDLLRQLAAVGDLRRGSITATSGKCGKPNCYQVMRQRFQSVLESERQEAVAKLMADHRLFAIPVRDKTGVMCGIVTVDDALQAVREGASREMQKVGGMEALDAPYLQTGLRAMLRKRAGWLSVLFLGEMLTATAMGFFENEIARAVVLALFIPLIISSGGNAGSQATTLVIRAMALGECGPRYGGRS